MKLRWVKELNEWVTHDELMEWQKDHEARQRAERVVPLPYIRADGMSATWCPADGKTYDSKSQYYGAVKATGSEIIGSDSIGTPKNRPYMPDRKARTEAIKKTLGEMRIK